LSEIRKGSISPSQSWKTAAFWIGARPLVISLQ
jgi:hypothetical protein